MMSSTCSQLSVVPYLPMQTPDSRKKVGKHSTQVLASEHV